MSRDELCPEFYNYFNLAHIKSCALTHSLKCNRDKNPKSVRNFKANIIEIVSPTQYVVELFAINEGNEWLPCTEEQHINVYLVDVMPLDGKGVWSEAVTSAVESFFEGPRDYIVITVYLRLPQGIIAQNITKHRAMAIGSLKRAILSTYQAYESSEITQNIEKREAFH